MQLKETDNYMPLALILAHKILQGIVKNAESRQKNLNTCVPMQKSQVTIEYSDNNKPVRIDTIVVSTNTMILMDAKMLAKIKKILLKLLFHA